VALARLLLAGCPLLHAASASAASTAHATARADMRRPPPQERPIRCLLAVIFLR